MQRSQPMHFGAARKRDAWVFRRKLPQLLAPPLVVAVLCAVLFAALYRLPHRSVQDVGDWTLSARGLYVPEKLPDLTYVYTDGDATLSFPQTGRGMLTADLCIGGPAGAVPVVAQVTDGAQQLNLGALQDVRVYHLLARPDALGDLRLRIRGTTTIVGEDPRPLGAMIDWIGVRSVGPAVPPPAGLAGTTSAILLLWPAMAPLQMPYRRRVLVLALLGMAMCACFVIAWGRLPLHLIWAGLGLAVAAGMFLARVEVPERKTALGRIALVVGMFVLWRVALWGTSAVGLHYGADIYRYAKELSSGFSKTISLHGGFAWGVLADAWMQWDSEHYQTIAVEGYSFYPVNDRRWSNIAFFPLYPLLMRGILPLVGHDPAVAALLIAHLAMLAAALLLFELVRHDFGHAVAYRTLILLLLFPTSFFFVAGYSESLALALAVAALWAIRRERWWLAGLAGLLLTLARLPGVMITPVLALAYLQRREWRWRELRPDFLAALLPLLGLVLFMLYQWWRFDTPFAFLIAQQRWKNHVTAPWHMPAQIVEDIRRSSDWEMAWVRLGVWALFVGLTIAALRRLPLPYGLTALLLLLPPYLANQTGSLIRHVLIAFPAFVALALLSRHLWVRWLVISVALPLLVALTLLFVNGLWVA